MSWYMTRQPKLTAHEVNIGGMELLRMPHWCAARAPIGG